MAALARSLTVRCVAVAWILLATVVFTRFADSVAPPDHLVRPLLVVGVCAIAIGVTARLARGRAILLSTALASLVGAFGIAAPLIVISLAGAGILTILERRPEGVTVAVVRLVAVLGLIGVVRAALVFDLGPPSVAHTAGQPGPPLYLVLLDGYPRGDTIASLGFDNSGFEDDLRRRGFDVYGDATSAHGWTHRTLTALLAGSPEGIPAEAGDTDAIRATRAELVAPAGWVLIDPPVGHVVMRGGQHLAPGGITEMEAHLLGQSIIGELAPDLGRAIIADGLRHHLEQGLELLSTTDATRVFAHLMAPHPPYLYEANGGPRPIQDCWPRRCRVFDNAIEQVFITLDEWTTGMQAQLATENGMFLDAIDAILERQPDAVIVLFSDHGARYSYRVPDEWRRSFLAARTPGKPDLFADEPHPHAVLRLIEEAYH